MKKGIKRKSILVLLLSVFLVGFIIPGKQIIPVQGAGFSDWNAHTFWYEPWGKSGVHKGIDIFARHGTPLLSSTHGVVLFTGKLARGGKVVVVLGPKWRIHYYAHLDSIGVDAFDCVSLGDVVGAVGDSGNAKGKPPHLHYSIVTLIPYPWRADATTQGWKKMFFIDPGKALGR